MNKICVYVKNLNFFLLLGDENDFLFFITLWEVFYCILFLRRQDLFILPPPLSDLFRFLSVLNVEVLSFVSICYDPLYFGDPT